MDKIKLSNRELLYLNSGIENSRKLSGAKFNFATVKTQRKFENDIKSINAAGEMSEGYQEYKRKLFELMKQFAVVVDDKPETVISYGDVFLKISPGKENEFSKEASILHQQYDSEIKNHKKQSTIYEQKILRDSTEIEIHKINKADFPENITLGHVDGLIHLIEPIKHSDKEKGEVKFTRLGIVQYRMFFLPVFSISKPEFVSAMIENIRTLSIMQEEILSDPIYSSYHDIFEKQRIALCEESCEYDIYNKPKVVNGDFAIKDYGKFSLDLDKLRKKHKKIIDSYSTFADKEIGVKMNMFPLDYLPKEFSGEQMQVIADFIK